MVITTRPKPGITQSQAVGTRTPKHPLSLAQHASGPPAKSARIAPERQTFFERRGIVIDDEQTQRNELFNDVMTSIDAAEITDALNRLQTDTRIKPEERDSLIERGNLMLDLYRTIQTKARQSGPDSQFLAAMKLGRISAYFKEDILRYEHHRQKAIPDVSVEALLGRKEVALNTAEIAGYLNDQVILVTGGGGSIGSELCRQIANFKPKQLIILDNYENTAQDLQNELRHSHPDLKQKVVIASVRDMDRLKQVFAAYRPGVVFHAAAHKHVDLMENDPGEAIKTNVVGTLNTAQCADAFHVKKFVLVSTDKAVNPTNVMGASKRVCEMIVQSLNPKSNTDYVAVRFGNVLGSNGSVLPLFKRQIAHGGPVTVTHPDITRYFMTIPEAARLVIQAGALAQGGEIFILDMGEPVKIRDLAEKLIRLSGFEPGTDIKIEYVGLRPGEKLHEELLLSEEGINSTPHDGIFVAAPGNLDYHDICDKIELLTASAMRPDDLKTVLAEVVPTYRTGDCHGNYPDKTTP